MVAYTNMLWPDDPYGTGQLWRKEPQLLAAFGTSRPPDGSLGDIASYAVVYIRLHRTKQLDLSSGFSFGFRALTATDPDDEAELVESLDLDAMRARRLSSVVAGNRLGAELLGTGCLGENSMNLRGLRALVRAWEVGRNQGFAQPVELSSNGPGADLESMASASGIDAFTPRHAWTSPREPRHVTGTEQHEDEALALRAVERSLIIGLVAGRLLGRCAWAGSLNIADALSANLADCFPTHDFGHGR